MDFSLSPEQQAEIEAFKSSTKNQQDATTKKGNTGIVPSLLQMPSFAAPNFFKMDASGAQPASSSALLRAQLKGFASWLVFAPLVEAFEI